MTRYLVGTFLAALAMFIWGAVFWMNPITNGFFETPAGEAEVGAALLKHFPRDGTYFVPGPQKDEATQTALHEKGPLATIHIKTAGAPVMPPRTLILGFVQLWVSTLLASFLAVRAVPAVSSAYGKRLWFFVLIGLLIAIYANFASPIWMNQPWTYHVVYATYHFSGWLLGGLVLAATIKPQE